MRGKAIFRNISSLDWKRKHKLPERKDLCLFKAAIMLFSIFKPSLYLILTNIAGRVMRAETEFRVYIENQTTPSTDTLEIGNVSSIFPECGKSYC